MGRSSGSTNPFTNNNVKDKQLVINMLKYEEEIAKGETGQSLYRNEYLEPHETLKVEKALNRLTLTQFGFDTSEESVENYRTIFRTYFNSPDDYDADVINSSYYMRENKCVFYKNPDLKLGEEVPNGSSELPISKLLMIFNDITHRVYRVLNDIRCRC